MVRIGVVPPAVVLQVQLQKSEFPTFMSVYISILNIRVEKGIRLDLEGKISLTPKSQVIQNETREGWSRNI